MSKENHPNFHAVKFSSDIIRSYYDSLRGEATTENAPDISNLLLLFVERVEEQVDLTVRLEGAKRHAETRENDGHNSDHTEK